MGSVFSYFLFFYFITVGNAGDGGLKNQAKLTEGFGKKEDLEKSLPNLQELNRLREERLELEKLDEEPWREQTELEKETDAWIKEIQFKFGDIKHKPTEAEIAEFADNRRQWDQAWLQEGRNWGKVAKSIIEVGIQAQAALMTLEEAPEQMALEDAQDQNEEEAKGDGVYRVQAAARASDDADAAIQTADEFRMAWRKRIWKVHLKQAFKVEELWQTVRLSWKAAARSIEKTAGRGWTAAAAAKMVQAADATRRVLVVTKQPAADTWRRVLRAWSVVTKILHTVEEHDGHMSIEDELPDLREAFRGPLPFLVTIQSSSNFNGYSVAAVFVCFASGGVAFAVLRFRCSQCASNVAPSHLHFRNLIDA